MQVNEVDLYKSNLFYYISETYGKVNETLKVSASSTYLTLGPINRSTIDTIFDLNSGRWVSDYETDPHFIIEFPGKFYIQSCAFKWSAFTRYNTKWMVEGFIKSAWKIIDSQDNKDLCSDKYGGTCSQVIERLFVINDPCYVSKLRFTATGPDSQNQNIFSLNQILLFGQYYPNYTNKLLNKHIKLISAFTLISIINFN